MGLNDRIIKKTKKASTCMCLHPSIEAAGALKADFKPSLHTELRQKRATWANLSGFKHQFRFKPVAKSCLLYLMGRSGSHMFALAVFLHIVKQWGPSCSIGGFNENARQ